MFIYSENVNKIWACLTVSYDNKSVTKYKNTYTAIKDACWKMNKLQFEQYHNLKIDFFTKTAMY